MSATPRWGGPDEPELGQLVAELVAELRQTNRLVRAVLGSIVGAAAPRDQLVDRGGIGFGWRDSELTPSDGRPGWRRDLAGQEWYSSRWLFDGLTEPGAS